MPLGPGSGVDITARLVGDSLSKKWGQPVIIENRPGGDGIIAITGFIGANDDHVLLFTPTGAFSSHPYTQEKLPYDPNALAPIARVTNTIVAFAVPASLNINSLKELLDTGEGAAGQAQLGERHRDQRIPVPGLSQGKQSRHGEGAVSRHRVGNQRSRRGPHPVLCRRLRDHAPQLQSGKVKVLAITNRDRAKGAADIPTAAEAGFSKLQFDGLVGIFGPPKMPDTVRAQIAADAKQILSEPEIAAKLTATGQNVSPGTPAEFAAAQKEQTVQVDGVAKLLGLKRAQ